MLTWLNSAFLGIGKNTYFSSFIFNASNAIVAVYEGQRRKKELVNAFPPSFLRPGVLLV